MRGRIGGIKGHGFDVFIALFDDDLFPVQATELISKLYAAHQEGKKNVGFDIEGDGVMVKDAKDAGVLDLFLAKWWGLKLATGAACTVLRVDQVGVATRDQERLLYIVYLPCVRKWKKQLIKYLNFYH